MKHKRIILVILAAGILFALLAGSVIYYVGWKVEGGQSKYNKKYFQGGADVSFIVAENLYLTVTKQRCSKPIRYSIGKIDEDFNISEEYLKNILKRAEDIWEADNRGALFEYDPDADFKINLVYDERQEMSKEKQIVDSRIKEIIKERQQNESKHNELEQEYQKEEEMYFNTSRKMIDVQYNYEMDVINYNYGFEEDKKREKKLNRRRDTINGQISGLIAKEKYLNSLGSKINKIIEQDKKLVKEHNELIDEFRSKYKDREGRVFDYGEYKQAVKKKEINVYAFIDDNDLLLILAHEFGHALGVEHIDNSKSLMYYLMEKQDVENLQLTNDDIIGLQEVCDL
jgi:hypothetical protein